VLDVERLLDDSLLDELDRLDVLELDRLLDEEREWLDDDDSVLVLDEDDNVLPLDSLASSQERTCSAPLWKLSVKVSNLIVVGCPSTPPSRSVSVAS
jgi:hypothetical protein